MGLILAAGLIGAARASHSPAVPTPATTMAVVTWVTDGDTVRVRAHNGDDLGRIRLLGINAPELAHDGQPQQCWAAQARDRLAQLVPVGSTVTLIEDPTQPDRDQYGRLLRYVLIDDGSDIQETLCVRGTLARSGSARRSPGQRSTPQPRPHPRKITSDYGPGAAPEGTRGERRHRGR